MTLHANSCESEKREINTFLAIQCMQACARGCYKTINTDFKQNNTPFVLRVSGSQPSSEGNISPPTLTKFAGSKHSYPTKLFQLGLDR